MADARIVVSRDCIHCAGRGRQIGHVTVDLSQEERMAARRDVGLLTGIVGVDLEEDVVWSVMAPPAPTALSPEPTSSRLHIHRIDTEFWGV
jgi:hypothetical protein